MVTIALWTYKQVFRLAPLDSILISILIILAGLTPTADAYFASKFIDALVSLYNSQIGISALLSISQPFTQITLLAASVTLLGFMIRRLLRYFKERFRTMHLNRQEDLLAAQVAELDVADFEDSQTHDEIRKARNSLWKLRNFVDMSYYFLQEIIQIFVAGIIIFKFSWIMGIFLFLTTIPAAISSIAFSKKFYDYWDKNTMTYRKRDWTSWTLTDESLIKQNRVSQMNSFLKTILRKHSTFLVEGEMKLRDSEVKWDTTIQIFNSVVNLAIPFVFAVQLLNGNMTLGLFNFYTGRCYDFKGKFDDLINSISNLLDGSFSIQHVRHLLERSPKIVSGNKRISLTSAPKIEFKNVSFKYPKSNKYALSNFNITINPNEEIAVVGENGAGKTTFIKLLLRLYDPTGGEILVNGRSLKDIDINQYYKVIGTLFQDYELYGMLSVKENIILGAPFSFSHKKLVDAAKQAQAHAFIEELPQKYGTLLSKEFEGGTKLSTGQAQKVALARMFYRNSPVLIFDEPTASIDPQAEYKIFKRIYQFMKDKTVIIISHKFSTVRNAQKTYVMDKGRIIESGSHKELMALNGVYADSFRKQAEGYNRED